ncbi:hypothetical protein JCM8547_000268 [Rhodosporidiobolus lusitaniae]
MPSSKNARRSYGNYFVGASLCRLDRAANGLLRGPQLDEYKAQVETHLTKSIWDDFTRASQDAIEAFCVTYAAQYVGGYDISEIRLLPTPNNFAWMLIETGHAGKGKDVNRIVVLLRRHLVDLSKQIRITTLQADRLWERWHSGVWPPLERICTSLSRTVPSGGGLLPRIWAELRRVTGEAEEARRKGETAEEFLHNLGSGSRALDVSEPSVVPPAALFSVPAAQRSRTLPPFSPGIQYEPLSRHEHPAPMSSGNPDNAQSTLWGGLEDDDEDMAHFTGRR